MIRAFARTAAVAITTSLVLVGTAQATPTTPAARSSESALGRGDRVVAPASLIAALAKIHEKVPAFSRQTGLACSACHYQFPQLTPFGRLFKLNGYTLTGIPTIGQPGDSAGKESLKLLSVPPLAAMVVTSVTQTSKSVPGTQNGTASFPQQLSIFAAGQITPNLGAFTQFTYAQPDGSFGIDNVDIRYANHLTVADKDVLYGLTLHNNPTVQDVWNTVPAWGFPFMSSGASPSPLASTFIDGALGQQVLGFGAYTLFNSTVYAEFTAYRSALQGVPTPADSTATNAMSGLTPYWRLALQHESDNTSLMIGTFGFSAHVYPTGVTGFTDTHNDVAFDAQAERRLGGSTWIGRGLYIHEAAQLNATLLAGGATTAAQTLSTTRASLSYMPDLRHGLTFGYFQTNGTTDPLLYPGGPVTGSANGSPNTSGFIGEANFNPWQNARVGLQYVAYSKFNGASTSYDVFRGRNAADNNTIYLYTWFAF